jgi:hypothetical protein
MVQFAKYLRMISYDLCWGQAKLALTKIVNYFSFIVLATVITIVNYDRNTFIVKTTGDNLINLFWRKIYSLFLSKLDILTTLR